MPLDSSPNPHTVPSPSSNGTFEPVSVRLLMVDDHPLVRQGLRTILGQFDRVQVVGEAATGEEAVALTQTLAPHVVIMDINMPIMGGIEATRQITAHFPHVVVIDYRFTMLQMAAAMKQAGAAAFVTKDTAPEQLYQAIRDALQGRVSRSHADPD